MPPSGARHALAATRGVPTEQLTALRSAAGHVPLDAIADVLSAQPGRRMAIEDLNTIFGTSAPGASAKLAQAALQVAHLVPVPGERPVLVLDEKWRRPAAPHLGTGRHAHAARTLAGRITQIELQRHGAGAIERTRDRTPNFETRIDPKRGAWPTLPTCVATERAELRQRALGAGREAVAARRRRGGAPRGQAHAQHARESISEVRRAVDAALDAPAPHRTAKAATATAARAARPTAMELHVARLLLESAPDGLLPSAQLDAIASEPAARARLEVVLDAVARRVAHPKTGEECFAAAETDVGAAAEAPGPAEASAPAEAPIAEAPAEAEAEVEADAEEAGNAAEPVGGLPGL